MTSNSKDINQGYQKYSKDYESKLKLIGEKSEESVDGKKTKKVKQIRYPHGYFSVFFITLITVAVFLLYYFFHKADYSNPDYTVEKNVVYSLSVAFAIGFFLNLVWLFSRRITSLKFRYTSRKMMEIFTFKDQRKKKNLAFSSLAVNNINNFSDYQKFCEMKKLTTAFIFWISFGIYTVAFIATIIASIIVAS